MFQSLHTSSSVPHIKSTVNIQIIRVCYMQCYSIVKIQFKNFYLTIFIALNTNIMNKTIKTFTLAIKKLLIFKNILVLKRLKWRMIIKQNITEGNRANKG